MNELFGENIGWDDLGVSRIGFLRLWIGGCFD